MYRPVWLSQIIVIISQNMSLGKVRNKKVVQCFVYHMATFSDNDMQVVYTWKIIENGAGEEMKSE